MKKKCRAMVLVAPEKMEMQTFDLPETGTEDGLLEVELVGVCGSDPGIFRGKQTFGPRKYPFQELITHTVPLAQAERAVRLVGGEIEGESPLKVVIDPKG